MTEETWRERAEALARLWRQREVQLAQELSSLRPQSLFDKTVSDLISELCDESAGMADKIEQMGPDLRQKWPGAYHMAHRLKRKSALLKRAYKANVEK